MTKAEAIKHYEEKLKKYDEEYDKAYNMPTDNEASRSERYAKIIALRDRTFDAEQFIRVLKELED